MKTPVKPGAKPAYTPGEVIPAWHVTDAFEVCAVTLFHLDTVEPDKYHAQRQIFCGLKPDARRSVLLDYADGAHMIGTYFSDERTAHDVAVKRAAQANEAAQRIANIADAAYMAARGARQRFRKEQGE